MESTATALHTEDGSSNMFFHMNPIPIKVSREQSNGSSNNTTGLQYSLANLSVFQNLPKETSRGIDDLTRMKMAIVSTVPEEIKWALKKFLAYSNKAPYMINLKNVPELLPLFTPFINNLIPIISCFDDPLPTSDSTMDVLQMGLNCVLILRNLSQDSDSVQVLVQDHNIKNFVLFVLTHYEQTIIDPEANEIYYSNTLYFNELLHYVLDIMEAISSYLAPAKKDNLYFQALVTMLNYTKDRYMVISILRSLSRLLVRSKADEESAADNVDSNTLSLITTYLLVESDSELITASLDFFYQYILPGNERISTLLGDHERLATMSTILPKLLTYNIVLPDYEAFNTHKVTLVKRLKAPAPKEAPFLDDTLFQQLLRLEEPLRSTTWLRCCFEQVQDAEFTQITLWRNYESKFAQSVKELTGKKLLPAVEFIKNVSNAFTDASAMVITDPVTGKKRFVIKNIQPRLKPLSIQESKEYFHKLQNSDSYEPTKTLDDSKIIYPVKQNELPQVEFSSCISDVSKVAATFLCLLSNDAKGVGNKFCRRIKLNVLHSLANVPPLTSALSEFMENTKSF